MPTFEVSVEEVYDQVVAAHWRAYRTICRTNIYTVEAEDEREAEDLVFDGRGTLVREEDETSDCYDSEYWEEGGVLSEEHTDTNVDVRTPRPPQQGAIFHPSSGLSWIPTHQTREPDWEI